MKSKLCVALVFTSDFLGGLLTRTSQCRAPLFKMFGSSATAAKERLFNIATPIETRRDSAHNLPQGRQAALDDYRDYIRAFHKLLAGMPTSSQKIRRMLETCRRAKLRMRELESELGEHSTRRRIRRVVACE